MVTLVGSQIWWTWETEDVFRRVREGSKHAMKDFAAKLTGQLYELTMMVRAAAVRRGYMRGPKCDGCRSQVQHAGGVYTRFCCTISGLS